MSQYVTIAIAMIRQIYILESLNVCFPNGVLFL